jgi:hypothetical protein
MSMDGWVGRTVRRTDLFDELGTSLAGSLERFDEMISGLEYILSNRPAFFPEIPGMPGIRVARTHPFDDDTSLRVFYRITGEGEAVDLLFVELIDVSPGD